ncbi:MAG TPA: ribonuclease HI [Firmicutes bacterium]|nr:MAG: RNase H [Peptococcaceae bacterium 1109]HHT72382.1 ribonuclease HI [Bacillota bacterium]
MAKDGKKLVEIYTDGACSNNPGPGGWGAVLLHGPHVREFSGFEPHTTNQRMELTAAVKGLQQLKEPCNVKLYSDSAYLINGFTLGWIDNWQKNGWRNSRGAPVSNADLWRALVELSQKHSIQWIKVKGHSDNKWNNHCDELARAAIRKGMN